MDSNQDFGSILRNSNGLSPEGQQQEGLGSLLNQSPYISQQPQATPSAGGGRSTKGSLDPAFVDSIAAKEGLSDTQKRVMNALLAQESGYGRNARTSVDGAQGAGQIMPGTFQRYAKPGEDINDTAHNLAVMSRIVKDAGTKFGDDPAKIATAYFSGDGNVNQGSGSAWKNDRADGNGKRVSSYVADVLGRVGEVPPTQAQAANQAPDLSKAPKWADVEAKPAFKALPAEKQAEAKAAYFDYWIAPHSGERAEELRGKFLAPASTDRTAMQVAGDTAVQLAEGVNTIFGAVPNLVAPEGRVAKFFNDNAETWRKNQSPQIQQRSENASKAIDKAGEDGVISQIAEAASQYFNDPGLAARFVTTNLPSMIPGIGAMKVAQAAALARGASAAKAASVATTAAGGVNAVLNAGGARGEAFEDIKNTLIKQGYTPEQAEIQAIADSRIVAAIGGAAGFASGKMGLEKALSGAAGAGGIRAGAGALAKELAGEQIEEVAPKIATNMQAQAYDKRSALKDVGRTIVETGIGSAPGAAFAGVAEGRKATLTPDGRLEEVPEAKAPAPAPEPTPNPTPEPVADQDAVNFAKARYQQLREKQDGKTETVATDDGMADQETAGAGLSPTEQQEFDGLKQAANDPAAIRTLYGLDQETTTESTPNVETQGQDQADGPAPGTDASLPDGRPEGTAPEQEPAAEATAPQEDVSNAVGIPEQQDEVTPNLAERSEGELRQQLRDANDRGVQRQISEELARRKAEAEQAVEQVAETAPPKTEKESKQRKALDRIAKGTAYFGKQSKAQEWVEANGLTDTHTVEKDASGANKWNIVAKKEDANGTQATETQQAAQEGQAAPSAEQPVTKRVDGNQRNSEPMQELLGFKVGDTGLKVKNRTFPNVTIEALFTRTLPGFAEPSNMARVRTHAGGINDVLVEDLIRSEPVENSMGQITDGKLFAKPKTEKAAKQAKKATAMREKADRIESAGGDKQVVQSLRDQAERDAPTGKQDLQVDVSKSQEKIDTSAEPVQETTTTDQFANNKLFTADKVAAARARMKSKLGTLNSGLDPELMVDGVTIAGAYIESGVRTFSEYSKAMIGDFGDKIRPYLRSFYEGVRHYPGLDTKGMSTPAEIDLMESQGTAEHTKPAPGTEAAVGEVVKAPKKTKERKPTDIRLKDDYGVAHIDGYDGNGEGSSGPVKAQFLKDTQAYMRDVSLKLQDSGFVPATTKNGKALKAVSVNESGVAGSGDVMLSMFHPEMGAGIYITIGGTAIRGAVPTTTSGISVMMRVTKQGDPYGGDQNRWLPVNLSSTELADLAVQTVQKNPIVKSDAKVQNQTTANDTQESQNASPVQAEPVSKGTASQDQENASTGNGDSKPVGTGVAADGAGSNQVGGVPASTGEPGGTGAQRTDSGRNEPPVKLGESGSDGADTKPTSSNDDHVIDAEEIGKGGLAKKYKDNIAAIKILKALGAEGRVATPDERKALAKYVGWGAMKGAFDAFNKSWAKQHAELKELLTDAEFKAAKASTLDAHYTSPIAVGAMYDAMTRLGFKGGRVLEPSVGSGNFFGMMPRDMRNASQLFGVELDSLTARLAQALYPKAKIAHSGFEDFDIPAEYFDAVVGNPPFGSQTVIDKDRSPYSGFSVHNYFLAKAIDKLRPGGIMQVVVSHNFMDAVDGRTRKWIGERATLIGAVRLPDTAFKENAGTEVVTDILIFQKNDPNAVQVDNAGEWQAVVDQVNTNPKTGEPAKHKVNEFFAKNTDMVLGTPSAGGTMYTANQYTVTGNGDLKAQLADWVKSLPEGVFDNIDRKADSAVIDMAVPDGVKVGSFYVDGAGKVMQRGPDVMGNKTANEWTPKNQTAPKRMRGMIALRDLLRTQMRLERSLDSTTDDIEANRAEMNKQYDAFLKEFGHLNSTTNRGLFMDDTESQLLQALEFDYDKGISKATADKEGIDQKPPSAVKADIFKRRVAFPPQDFLTVSNAKDALLASLNYRGKVDGAYMAEVYNKPMAEIVKELGDVVFEDPQAGIVTADEYLSGDVKTKLAEAQAAAQDDAKFKRNVKALETVIPKDKKPSEISVGIGASFVPAELYQQFVKEITGAGAVAHYMKATGQWLIDFNGQADPALNVGKYGTEDLDARALFQLAMLGKGAVVKKTFRNVDGSTTTVVLEKETEAARSKQNAIKDEWKKWIWADAARANQVATIYNDTMNRLVDRKFDGLHLTFPGMNPAISLLNHQKNGVWRGLQSYQVLYDHVVGAGKTFEMATLAMEMRRLGIARKPLFVVPNHLTLQWRSEFTRLYPGSNILAATPEDFAKDKRERMFSKIITGDWDAVVIGHSSLKKIGLPEETERAVLQEQIDEISQAIEDMKRTRGDRNITRDMEVIKKNLEAKMKDKMAAIGKRSKVVTFDELGVDAMFVDEMHEFKNLTYNSTMDRNPGMGNPAGSGKAFDMFVKTRWLFDTFGQKTPFITATGTPVSNSLVEMYNMQRYMQYPTMKQKGLHVFDAWAKQFGSVESVYEVAPSGSGYRQSSRFAKFTNLPGLMSLYNSFADTVTLDDLKAQEEAQGKRFPVPKMVGGRPVLVVAKRSPAVAERMGVPMAELNEDGSVKFEADPSQEVRITQDDKTQKWTAKVGDLTIGNNFDTEQDAKLKIVEKALTPKVSVDPGSILGRFANLRQLTKQSKGKINALSLTGEANKMGLDYRLIDPRAADFPGSKINMAVNNMMDVYKKWAKDKGTQLVFCDMSIPLSARAAYGSKERRLYVRGDGDTIEMKRGTLHAATGHEDLPFFVVPTGEKESKVFHIYDAASGAYITPGGKTKAGAIEKASEIIADDEKRAKWIGRRESVGEIGQTDIDEFNNENDVETEGIAFFGAEDIAGMSGSAQFSVYDDIKAKLVAKGVPEREIAFIHDYDTPTAKDKLFKQVKAGDVRFLLGSTPKMGAGTNVQDLLVGLHHIDAPWRPSDLEQREGRIIRRGNKLYERDPQGFEVFIGRYATEQTYDTRRWQILEHKARGIEQLRNFDGTINEIDDIDGEAANSADMKAAASGDPLILEETKLRNEVRRLEQLQASHADEVLAMTRRATDQKEYASKHGPAKVQELKELIAETAKHKLDKDGWAPVRVDGQLHGEKESAAKAITDTTSVVRAGLAESVMIRYRGVEFEVTYSHGRLAADSPTGSIGTWAAAEPFSASGFIQRMKNYVDRLPAIQDDVKERIKKAEHDSVALLAQAKQPFAQAADLDKAREDYKGVQRALMSKGPAVPENQKPLVAKGMENQKAALKAAGFGEALGEFLGGESVTPKRNAKDDNSKNDDTDAGQADNSPDTVRAIGMLERRFGGDYLVSHPVEGWSTNGTASVAPIAQAFGSKVVGYKVRAGLEKADTWGMAGSNGTQAVGHIFLNVSTNRPHLAILGHETAHEMRKRRPDLYAKLSDAIESYVDKDKYSNKFRNSKVGRGSLWAGMTPDQVEDSIQEEFIGEVLSDGFMDTNFWRALGQKNKQLLAQVWAFVGKILGKVLGKDGTGYTKRTEQYLTDYAKVMQIAGEVMAEYGMNPGGMGKAMGVPTTPEEPTFNRKDDTVRRVQNNLLQFFGNRDKVPSLKTFGAYDKTLSTQFHKALKDKHYGKVFGLVNAMQNEVSLTSIRPAELAPGVLPRVDDVKSAFMQMVKGKKSDSNLTAAADAIFAGTLDGNNVMSGKVWSDDELKGMGLNDTGIALYRQARAAIDASLDEVAAAEAYAMAQGFVPKAMRRAIIDAPANAEELVTSEIQKQITMLDKAIKAAEKMGAEQQAAELSAARNNYKSTLRQVEKIFITAKNLKAAGYAPLMRFGKYTVTVQAIDPDSGRVAKDENGDSITLFYGQFETESEAQAVRAQMDQRYAGQDDVRVSAGTKSTTSHELYAGVSPETLALFAESIGADTAMRKYIELAMNERSALKRRLERKGTRGYSEDLPRVLSNFITSNGRFAAQRYYLRDLNNAIKYIPKENGDVIDEANALKKFMTDPNDPAAPVSSVMFAWFLGGSVAAALVNMSQPVMMTGPYLSQFGVGLATKSMAKALPFAMGKKQITDTELRAALKRASQEGIVDAQEIFHLYSMGSQNVAAGLASTLSKLPGVGKSIKAGSESARARINGFLTLWGSMFAVAEGFNRKLTFLAAWDIAKANGEKNPYGFAVRAVNETQGIYNKANRPNWARSATGRTIMTFKQFSLMYVELLSRMWKKGGPEGKRAALIMLAVLMLAAGEDGLPFAQDLDDLIDTIGQLFGLDTNMKRNKRRVAHEILGKQMGDLFLHGASSMLPLDFAGRLGLGNLIPGTGLLKPSDADIRGRQVAEVFGPTAGMATQIGDAYDAVSEGNPGKGVQNMMPKAIKDVMAAGEMAKKGYATDAKGRKVVDVEKSDAAIKAIGFQPTKVAQETRKTMPIYQDIALQKRTETSIVNQWVRGLADNDMEMAKAAEKRLDAWNRDNPGTPIRISPDQLRAQARLMVTDKDTRLLKSVPREMRARVGLDLAD